MRFVPVKKNAQLDVQALHRVRDRLVAERTALVNQARAFLLEQGLPSPGPFCSSRSTPEAPRRRSSAPVSSNAGASPAALQRVAAARPSDRRPHT
jgi:transposase